MSMNPFEILLQLLGLAPQLVVAGACIFYLAKKGATPEGILLTIASVVSLILHAITAVVIPYLMTNGTMDATSIGEFYSRLSFVYIIIGAAHAVGFILLILQALKAPRQQNTF
ncbi:hypothetical protein [Pseudochryseolinea flava]|uniref:Uncharacterized protein n=1 Tax=Pseudochryseolinea flava TaxID=2059302 RepID=A0A364XX41_9BACT|nr:hypothetical protein [Pseudochryseolinea flava]RAV98950.1 hypothetical protein DQQ10_21890 [Pseudochryseolinea flava]